MQFKKKSFVLLLLILTTTFVNAQVTIGTNHPPEPAALLSLKDQEATTLGGVSSTSGGFLLPRVELKDLKELFPFYPDSKKGDTDYENTAKPQHTGLYVYNLTQDLAKGLDIGIYFWDGEKWNLMEKGVTNAIFEIIDCDTDVNVRGWYQNDVPLDGSNLISITVNVTTPGKYKISTNVTKIKSGSTEPIDNGYYFHANGIFERTGKHIIQLEGSGSPIEFTHDDEGKDKVEIFFNDSATPACTAFIKVDDSSVKPLYGINCNSIAIHGVYKKDVQVTSGHYITVSLNVQTGAAGATYTLETDEIDGLKFHGEGILGDAGPQTITLYASGTPTNTAPKQFTIKTNSTSSPNQSCSVTIQPVISQKKVVTIGNQIYGFFSGGDTGSNGLVTDLLNYGEDVNSIIKYEGFAGNKVDSENTNTITTAFTNKYVNNPNPYDIVIITYPVYIPQNQIDIYVDYVNKGGVLIYLCQETRVENAKLISEIFNDKETITSSDYSSIGTNCNYTIGITSTVNDEITNGPFGDVRGLAWGEDFNNTIYLTWTPANAIVYSNAFNATTGTPGINGAGPSMLRHPTKNFFWCGDSGLIRGGNASITTQYPLLVGSVRRNGVNYPHYPIAKTHGNATTKIPVYNSVIFANVMAWALDAAEMNGINSGK